MVHRTYAGLPREMAIREFEALTPHVRRLLALQAEWAPFGPDHAAFGIALDGAETAAYHFTRRRHFYEALRREVRPAGPGNGRLGDRDEAVAAFEGLTPYVHQLRRLQMRCRPYGRDYLALEIARQSLETAAYHFTRIAGFYGAASDAAGPLRPAR